MKWEGGKHRAYHKNAKYKLLKTNRIQGESHGILFHWIFDYSLKTHLKLPNHIS